MKSRLGLILALTLPFAASVSSAPKTAKKANPEIQQLRNEMQELREYVARLERALHAKSVPAAPPQGADPLAAAEQTLAAGSPAPAQPAATGTLDPLDATLQQIKAGPTRTITGSPQTAFNPLISVVSDFAYNDPSLGDAGGVGENRDRATIREIEVAFQAPIDPFSRADIFIAAPNLVEGGAQATNVEVEEGYITYWRLPWNLQLRGGKWFLPFGKENPTHSHEYAYVDRSLAGQSFLGGEGISGAGIGLQTNFNLGDDYSTQLHVTGNLVSPKGDESLFVGPLENEKLALGRLNLYHELSGDTNLDFGYSHMYADHDSAARLDQRLQGLDLTFRWEPTDSLGYNKLLVRGEYMWGARRVDPTGFILPGTASYENDGAYAMANYTFDKYFEAGARWDNTSAARGIGEQLAGLGDITVGNAPGARLNGWASWLTWHSTEFNRFRLQYNKIESNFARAGRLDEDIVSLQWTWVMGPHGAHKY